MKRLSHLTNLQPPPLAELPKRSETGTARERYRIQKVNASNRGIEFLLTFEEWCEWWMDTGHYHEYGRETGQYVMARNGDIGPYALDNIRCLLSTDNAAEVQANRIRNGATRRRNTKF